MNTNTGSSLKKNLGRIAAAAILLLTVVILGGSLYTVPQKQYAAVRQFGKVVKVENTSGLKLKIPFIQNIQRISAARNIYDMPASDVITRDKKSMIADDYVIWEVTDPVKYIQTLNAVNVRAEERIEAAVYNATKSVISSMSQDEVIEARGEKLTRLITEDANESVAGYGITIVQAQIKALDLPADNKQAVYERMISERQNIAAQYTAEGNREKQKIMNETDKQVTVMKAQAQKEAAVLEAEGEAEYMRILQESYNTGEKAEFYNFTRSLDALKKSLKGGSKTIILDKDSEIAQILYGTDLGSE